MELIKYIGMEYIKYFTYSETINESLKEVISKLEKLPSEEGNEELLKGYKKSLKKGEKYTSTWRVSVLESKNNIPRFYNSKLKDYHVTLPEANEMDFVDDSIKECSLMQRSLEDKIQGFNPRPIEIANGIDKLTELKREHFLIKEYLKYLQIRKSQIPNEIKPEVRLVICAMEFGQMEDYHLKYINENMKNIIVNELSELQKKYTSSFMDILVDIFKNITDYQYEICRASNRPIEEKRTCYYNIEPYFVKGLKIDLQRLQIYISELKRSNLKDCIYFLNTLKVIIDKYVFIVNNEYLNAEKNYFFPQIIEFYENAKVHFINENNLINENLEQDQVYKVGSSKSEILLSYNILNAKNHEQMETIFNVLKKNSLISKNTKLIKFKAIFNNSDLSNFEKVDWIGSTASLVYFLKQFNIPNYKKSIEYLFKKLEKPITYSQVSNNKLPSKDDILLIDKLKIKEYYPNEK